MKPTPVPTAVPTPEPTPSPASSPNLLTNPAAESGTAGWTVTIGAPTARAYGAPFLAATDPGPANRGAKYWFGGSTAVAQMYQTVRLAPYEDAIAGSMLHARLTGYLGGYALTDDSAQVTMTFRNSTGQPLGCNYTIGPVGQWDRDQRTMEVFRDSGWHSVPVGTASIQVTYTCTRYQGTTCDGYADDLALYVSEYTEVRADHMDCPATTVPERCTQGYMLNEALPSPSAQLSVKQINAILKAHNDARRNVVPAANTMPMLTWDQTLADFAYNYVSTCPGTKHSSGAARTNVSVTHYGYLGENIAAGTDNTTYGVRSGATVVAIWAAEAKYFTYMDAQACLGLKTGCGNCSKGSCGEYKQMIWANTLTVGCAHAYCPGSTFRNYWVCEYGPGGNYIGIPPYNASAPKDACQLHESQVPTPVPTAVPTAVPTPLPTTTPVPGAPEATPTPANSATAPLTPLPTTTPSPPLTPVPEIKVTAVADSPDYRPPKELEMSTEPLPGAATEVPVLVRRRLLEAASTARSALQTPPSTTLYSSPWTVACVAMGIAAVFSSVAFMWRKGTAKHYTSLSNAENEPSPTCVRVCVVHEAAETIPPADE
jgi:hypothetical protein